MIEFACFVLGLSIGWLVSLLPDRHFARMASRELAPGMVYQMHLLPDSATSLGKHVVQAVLHTCTGKGGRRSAVTTLGNVMLHGLQSGRFVSRELPTLPPNAKFRLIGPCDESTLRAFVQRQGAHFDVYSTIAVGRERL